MFKGFANLARMLQFTHLSPCSDSVSLSYRAPSSAIIQHHSVSIPKFKKIHRIIHSCDDTAARVHEHIIQLGYSTDVAKSVLVFASHYDTGDNFLHAILAKITFDEFCQNSRNIIEHISTRFEIEQQLLIDLLFYEPPSKPMSGKGEAFIILLVDGGKKPQHGDVMISDSVVEVKGVCARIGGQKGYGSQFSVIETFSGMTAELVARSGAELEELTGDYNIRFTKNGFLDSIADKLVESSDIDVDDIAKVYKRAYSTFYCASTEDDFSWIDNHLADTGKIIDLRKYIEDFFYFSLRYYHSIEQFNHLVVIQSGAVGKRSTIQPGFFQLLTSDELQCKDTTLSKVGPHSPPTFGTSAPQDKFFAIKVKP